MRYVKRLMLLAALCGGLDPPAAGAAEHGTLEREGDVAEAGDCEIELAFEGSRPRHEPAQRETALRGACGIGWRTELEATVARTRAGDARERSLALEAKTTLREREDGRVGWAIGVGLGAERRGGAWRRSEQFVEIEATRQFGATWIAEAKLGTQREHAERRHSTIWALALEQSPSDAFEWRVELDGDDRSPPFLGASLRHTLGSEDLTVQVGVAARTGSPRERRLGLSLQFEF